MCKLRKRTTSQKEIQMRLRVFVVVLSFSIFVCPQMHQRRLVTRICTIIRFYYQHKDAEPRRRRRDSFKLLNLSREEFCSAASPVIFQRTEGKLGGALTSPSVVQKLVCGSLCITSGSAKLQSI